MRADTSALLSRRLSVHGGPAIGLSAGQASLRQRLLDHMRDGSLGMTSAPCPCGAQSRDQPVAEIDRYGIPLRSVLCMACGTLRFDPYLDEASLQRFYREYYQELYDRSADPQTYFEKQKEYGARMLAALRAHAPQASTIVEAGCGAGGALSVLQQAGMSVAGCDHSERLVRFGRSNAVGPLVVGSIAELQAALPGVQQVDAVYLHHVFEHLADPVSFLRACKRLLRPAGLVILVVPDISRIDRFPFPGGDVRLFLHVAHKFNYSRQGLARLAAKAGYALQTVGGFESRMAPEMWLAVRPNGAAVGADGTDHGSSVLRYLHRTERLYRLGILPGYGDGLARRLRRLKNTLLQVRP